MKKLLVIFITFLFLYSCSSTVQKDKQPFNYHKPDISYDSIHKILTSRKLTLLTPPKDSTHVDEHLVKLLDAILNLDQSVRTNTESSKNMARVDAENIVSVTKIIDDYGWLGSDVIGERGNATLFLVIQHADIKTQEKYLPIMRQAVINGKAVPNQLALLEDRVLLRHGKKQYYGSQLEFDSKNNKWILSPIEDEPNVNKRRQSIGLEPLEEYVKPWNIKYILPSK